MTNDYSLSDVASVVRNTAVTNLIEQTNCLTSNLTINETLYVIKFL